MEDSLIIQGNIHTCTRTCTRTCTHICIHSKWQIQDFEKRGAIISQKQSPDSEGERGSVGEGI